MYVNFKKEKNMHKLGIVSILSVLAVNSVNAFDIKPYASLKLGNTINYFEDFVYYSKVDQYVKIKNGDALLMLLSLVVHLLK